MPITEKIIKRLLKYPPKTADDLGVVLRKILRQTENSPANIPAKSALLKSYHKLLSQDKIKKSVKLEKLLVKRAVRTLSGVTIITALTKPFPCPGKCVYCPTEARMPKSYISDEPAAARALSLMFDPYQQVVARLKALADNGHPTDKIELIIKGGTWNSYPIKYQYWFIARCFEACNAHLPLTKREIEGVAEVSAPTPPTAPAIATLRRCGRAPSPPASPCEAWRAGRAEGDDSRCSATLGITIKKLTKLQKTNEKAKRRIIGLTLETRPDWINRRTILAMRELGCTRVELGVQNTNDKILTLIKRGHDTREIKRATQMLKNCGFKVDYHLMPQLPSATPTTDLKMMLKVFDDADYRPDMIKVYPCTVVKTSELYEWLKRGEYKTYSDRQLINMLKKFKTKVPRYIRISRLIRDIPSHHIQAGNKMTNLRQVIQEEMKKEGLKCKCLRCREVGHVAVIPAKAGIQSLKLFVDKYEASGGTEYFLSYEDTNRDVVYAFCRLRIILPLPRGGAGGVAEVKLPRANAGNSPYPLLERGGYPAYIRELHTYGQLINIGKKSNGASQHTGMGVKLVKQAEAICRQNKISKLAVISGVGVRGYYRKLGYKLEGTYMVKDIK